MTWTAYYANNKTHVSWPLVVCAGDKYRVDHKNVPNFDEKQNDAVPLSNRIQTKGINIFKEQS